MRITATHLVQWSDQREAQGLLPVLVRRLISATSHTTALAIPGGDSVSRPGWDGVVEVSEGCPWVPVGKSYWEIGTSSDPASKASSDFNKRANQISASEAAQAVFVFVTPRRWAGKQAWQEKARSQSIWADALVWDADDLEAWLEISPPTSLWLGMQLNIAGRGIEAVEKYWENWSCQSDPAITSAALFAGRESARTKLKENIQKRNPIITVVADSQSEAIAFVCALLIEEGLSAHAACVTSDEGWQFVDANPSIQLLVITDNRIGNQPAPREGVCLIVPMAAGDKEFNLMGIGGRAIHEKTVELRRPKPDEFEKSICELGIAASDATRYSRTLGRSWTVFRRMRARNPALKNPCWTESTDATSLLILTLVGSWNSTSNGDKACVEEIANRSYEDIENELFRLVTLDDAPVIKIGTIWKAKAPLELLQLMAPKLTNAVLTRFFQVARAAFEKPDPILELEEDQRWMASIYGKVREHSGVVLNAMAESIAKLGYFSDTFDSVVVSSHVQRFVRELLENADGERWLSISSFLRSFAEAAPDEFLNAVQCSLRKPDKPITRLITETQTSGVMGRCWHANLLWALELLAWYPARLGRVANILAELSHVETKGNWGNTPFNSLVSLFRPWFPQTAASVELRLNTLKVISTQNSDVGWKLLMSLLPDRYGSSVTANAKPLWRDDDAGVSQVTYRDIWDIVIPTADLLIEKASGNAKRIAELIPRINELDTDHRDKIISQITSATTLPDEEREIIRSAVRKFLSWENTFNKEGSQHDRTSADALRPLFDQLAAADLVTRHTWIFASGWVDLPDGREDNHEKADEARARARASAIQDIYQAEGWQGIERLAKRCENSGLVGWELVKEPFKRNELIQWLPQWYESQSDLLSFDALTTEVLHALPQVELMGFLQASLKLFKQESKIASFLINAPQNMDLWQFIQTLSQETQDNFWRNIQPYYIREESKHLCFLIDKLLNAGRPRAAMHALGDRADELSGVLLTRILKDMAVVQEDNTTLPNSWNIGRTFEALSKAEDCNLSELIGLEFTYYSVLKHEAYGVPHLMTELLSNPESFMELICLVYKPHHGERESLPENLQAAAQTAASLIHVERGVPGNVIDGKIDKESFFTWVKDIRCLAKEKDREVIADQAIGEWLSNWPIGKKLGCWPDPVIAELLEQNDCEDVRHGFYIGVRNSRGVTCRNPYDGGQQERDVAKQFRVFASYWEDSKPNLTELIKSLAKSYEREAREFDDDGLWSLES